jgi:hypothetical protein
MIYTQSVILKFQFAYEESHMQLALIKKVMIIAVLGLFSQFSMADNASALRDIAGIVASLNHFPSDADKATLMEISGDESLAGGIRDMATAVSNISHAANAEGKEAMARIVASDQAPDVAKSLAGIIASLNHTASAEAKATLAAIAQ